MSDFCTYVIFDPKSNIPRYVGKGKVTRPHEHFKCDRRTGRMLRKRKLEGFPFVVHFYAAESEQAAFDKEVELIAHYGRDDLQTGPLFNLTSGGEGVRNRPQSLEERQKKSRGQKAYYNKPGTREAARDRALKTFSDPKNKQKLSVGQTQRYANPEERAIQSARMKAAWKRNPNHSCKPCTIDGITIYPSRLALEQVLGRNKEGSGHPNFRYIKPAI